LEPWAADKPFSADSFATISPGTPGLICFFTSQSIASTSDFGDVLLPTLAMLKAQFGQKCPIRHPHLNSKLKADNLL
jgi:hypothetical protein